MFSIQIFRKNNSCDILRDIQGVYYHLSLYQMAVLFPTGKVPPSLGHYRYDLPILPTSMMPEVAKFNNKNNL